MVSLFERLDKGRPPPVEEAIKQLRGDSPIEKLQDWLANRWAKDTVTARQIYTLGPHCIRNRKAAVSLAQILVEQGWLVPTETRQYNTHEWKIVRRTTSIRCSKCSTGAVTTFCNQEVDKLLSLAIISPAAAAAAGAAGIPFHF